MTLSERNTLFKAGIVLCSVITLMVLGLSTLTIPIYHLMEENSRRPQYMFQVISGFFLENNYYAVHASLIMAVLFSLIGIILIYSCFERTSSPEILYIYFFTFSFSFEVIRLIIPMHLEYIFPSFYLLGASKVLLFVRYFGIFSLFTAGICAAGLEVQKTRNTLFIMTISVLLITLGVPIDTQTWDTSFFMANGYSSMFRLVEAVMFVTTIITFFIAAKVRSTMEYCHIGIGVAFAFFGRNILLGTDNWAGSVLGIFLLSFGTWFICSKLHKIHLWL